MFSATYVYDEVKISGQTTSDQVKESTGGYVKDKITLN